MDFTFGIVTGPNKGETDEVRLARLTRVVNSIASQQIPNYEIIIVGPGPIPAGGHITRYEIDETARPHPWITRKKNIITHHAQYEHVVYMHDYVELDPGWYAGQERAGYHFAVRMDMMLNDDRTRFRDWTLDPYEAKICGMACLLPYDVEDLSRFQYISGAYWVAKREVMQDYPLHEGLYWGCAEDMEWSQRVRKAVSFSMNINSSVHLLRRKAVVYARATREKIMALRVIKEWLGQTYGDDHALVKKWAGPVPKPQDWGTK